MSMSASEQIVGFPWYRRGEYARIQEVFEDSHLLPGSFHEWLHRASQVVKRLEERGVNVVKVEIEPNNFVEWCEDGDRPVNSASRDAYVQECAESITEDEFVAFGAPGGPQPIVRPATAPSLTF